MTVITLYRYEREGGGVTVSPQKPEGAYTIMFRLVADEGKTLVNGDISTSCVDVETPDGWTEIDDPAKQTERKRI